MPVFPGGVVRLKYHLSGIPGGGIHACSKVSETTKNAAMLSLNVVSKKRKTKPSSSGSDGGSSKVSNADCSNEVGYLLAKLFETTGINYDLVESSSFTNLVSALIKSGPGCMLPSSSELRSKLIPSFRKEVEDYVSGVKQSWIETGCTLMPIFEFNEKVGRSFVSIFGCSRGRTVLLNTSEVPANTNLVVPFLQETVHSVVQIVGSDNIVQCIVDASEYGEYFSSFLGNQFPHVYLTNCAAREIHLLFEEICRDVGWVRTTFSKIKSIVDYMCSDTTILALLRKYTKGKELKQPLGSNCLSNYKMLESILDAREELVQLVRSHEWLASGYNKGQRGSEVTTYIEDSKTWDLGEKVQKALRSLSQVLYLVDFHDSSSGYLLGVMEIVEHSISQLLRNNQDMYQKLWDIFKLKMGQTISDFHFVAAFSNPAYMCTEQGKNTDMKPVINYILERFIAAGDQDAFVEEVYEYRKMLSDESKPFKSKGAKIYLPCQWWECCGEKLTMLRNLAIRILSQPCSTSTCKSSLRTVEAVLVKQQRGLARVIKHLDSKMNAILMERFNVDKAYEREKKVLEEFSKHMSNNGSQGAFIEARCINGKSTSRPLDQLPRPRQLKLCFTTAIESPIYTGQNVEGEKGRRIHVHLEDSATGRVVKVGPPSMLTLSVSVLDGGFSNELSSDECRTREHFNNNDLSETGLFMGGDLRVTLIQGEGMLGTFSFNCSSRNTESGKFKLAVKTDTGDCEGTRIIEGISNAFVVEDVEVINTQHPEAYVDVQDNSSFFSNFEPTRGSDTDQTMTDHDTIRPELLHDIFSDIGFQGITHSVAQTAARRVKKKSLMWKLRSRRARGIMVKRRSQEPSGKKRRGNDEVLEARDQEEVYSTGSNNVDQPENGDERMELEEIDCLSSTSPIKGDSISMRPNTSSGGQETPPRGSSSSPTDLSTTVQLPLTTDDEALQLRQVGVHSISAGDNNNVNQQEDRNKELPEEGHDTLNVTTSVIVGESTPPLKPKIPEFKLFGVKLNRSSSSAKSKVETREVPSIKYVLQPQAEQQFDEKLKKKIVKVASSMKGIETIKVDNDSKKLIVTGKKLDAIALERKLRKVCPMYIVSLEHIREKNLLKKAADRKNDPCEIRNQLQVYQHQYPYYYTNPTYSAAELAVLKVPMRVAASYAKLK